MLKENLESVKIKIHDACAKIGRDPEDVLLIAVSKTKPEEDILTLYEAGQRDFGENYVQELRTKEADLPKDIRWHMIGHLQRNKVKYIAPYVAMIHSVDSVELAKTIDKEAAKCGRVIPVLIEVNVGEEESKFGLAAEEASAFYEEIKDLPNIDVRGYMTSAPYVTDPEEVRPVFAKLRKLSLDTSFKNRNNNEGHIELSMGMSNDFITAIEEGSTMVRVGTSIFGARNYT